MTAASADGGAAKPFRVGLLGHGTVGSAFDELLSERADSIAAATGRRPELSGVLTRSRGSFDEVLAGADAIVELIGGLEPARDYAIRTLEAGKPLVTANKQLLSQHGDELFAAARRSGAQLRYEATVAGVVPVVRVMRESFAGAHIEKVHGIVNGTTNYILSEMARTGATYADALGRAQELGYAEADPSEDVNGKDAAAKMAILARLAFHAAVALDDVPFEGIEQITPDDIDYAKEFGLVLKLLGVAERRDGGVSVRVFPCFLYGGHPLASVVGPFNAVTLESPTITEVTLSGPGAGGPQTASAVLGDVVSVMSSEGMDLDPIEDLRFIPGEEVESAFYLHLDVEDRPGVLAQIAQILGDHGVSVKSVVQKGMGANARLVMVMHQVAEGRFNAAVREISELDLLRARPRSIRVVEEEFVS
jgi:homoserine dehydrogenase